ncbi:MAG: hypothetical protein COX65_06875, partial [Elusimicrobia bacterium CG_4_10_14_0_2_um_filter_56_8]
MKAAGSKRAAGAWFRSFPWFLSDAMRSSAADYHHMGPGILIIVFKGIGDVLLTTPLIRALKKGLPESRLYFLTRRPSLGILENNPNLSGVFC